jgi:UDP-glucose 4-epimerase
LEAAVAHGVERFVFTSTTSLMISREIRAGEPGGAERAVWITEEMAPLLPRNIYGVTKLAGEHLCRLFHQEHGLPVVVLRTSRFFPEADDGAYETRLAEENIKANELLFRRLTVEDAAESHVVALACAPAIGYDEFIVSAPPPFRPEDGEELIDQAPAVVERYFPRYREVYDRLGWSMFPSIDRVYDPGKAARRLGFVCRTGFAERLAELEQEPDRASAP